MGILLDYLEDYQYYKAPEGQDPLGKVIGFGKWGFLLGSGMAVYDCTLLSKCQNLPQFLNTAGYWVLPLTGMCVTFSSFCYILNQTRKKDDKWNYVGGVLPCGGILYAWSKSIPRSMLGTALMLLVAVIKKDIKHYNKPDIMANVRGENRWTAPWRNLEKRNYLFSPVFKHNKEEYWRHF